MSDLSQWTKPITFFLSYIDLMYLVFRDKDLNLLQWDQISSFVCFVNKVVKLCVCMHVSIYIYSQV